MKILLLIFAGFTVLVATIAVIGACLPRAHVATRCATYRKPPAELYALVRAFDQLPTWRSGLQSVELLPPDRNRPSYREKSRHGIITYRVLDDQPGKTLTIEIADEDLPFGGRWTFAFSSAASGGTLRITEHGEVKNVLFRFLSRFVFGHSSTIETYLRDLGRKVGEEITLAP